MMIGTVFRYPRGVVFVSLFVCYNYTTKPLQLSSRSLTFTTNGQRLWGMHEMRSPSPLEILPRRCLPLEKM